MTTSRFSSPIVIGIVSLLLGVLYVIRVLVPHDMDPSILLALGEDSPVQTQYAQELLGDVTTRSFFGHDGKFFFAQANDPIYLHPAEHAATLDRPVYRAQRMLFPLLAGGFGLFGPHVVVWALPALNVLAMGLGGWATSLLARRMGATAWLGLAFPLNFGVLSDLDVDGSGIVALLGVVAAVLFAETGRYSWAAGLMVGASLAREVMLAAAVGLVIGIWLNTRQVQWRIVALPGLATGLWHLYIRARIGHLPSATEYQQPFDFPFKGIVDSVSYWRGEPLRGLLVLLLIAAMLAFAMRGLRSRYLIGWCALPFVAMSVVLHTAVWREPYDIARALAPIFTAYPLILFARANGWGSSPQVEHVFD